LETTTPKNPENTEDRLIDVKEASRLTSLSEDYFYKMLSEQNIPFTVYRFGRRVAFPFHEVRAWREAHRQKG
jgi:excisionase family DNA binding protein